MSLGQNGWHIARENILEKEGQKCAVTPVMSTGDSRDPSFFLSFVPFSSYCFKMGSCCSPGFPESSDIHLSQILGSQVCATMADLCFHFLIVAVLGEHGSWASVTAGIWFRVTQAVRRAFLVFSSGPERSPFV